MTTPFVKFLLDMLGDLGDVRSRAMFGGHGIYHDGVMIEGEDRETEPTLIVLA